MTSERLYYKYQNLKELMDENGKKRIYTIENLANNQLYFSDPTKFNDPFDCLIRLNFEGTQEQWIEYFCRDKGCTIEKAKEIVDSFPKNADGLVSPHKNLVNVKVPRVGCFCEINNDILMWSHYADYHRGICLCFEATPEHTMPLYEPNTGQKEAISGKFERVIYDPNNELCVLNAFDNEHENYRKAEEQLYKKFEIWDREHEYRIVLTIHSEDGLMEYYKGCLKGVIFGLRTDEKYIMKVYNAIDMNYDINTVSFCEAKEVPGKCEICIKPIYIQKYIGRL